MRERIRFLLIYFVFWVIFFVFARILFLAYHVEDSKLLTLEMVFGIFRHGIVMDISMAGYYSIFPFLWVSFSNFIDKGAFQNTIFSYTFILLTISNLIIVADLEVYNIWNFRIDATPLKFLTSPREAFISIKNSPILRLILSYILLILVASIIVYRIVANKIYDWKHIRNFPFVIYGLLLTAALIIPIRGGFSSKVLKQKTVYFSQNNFANVSALNAPWNFAYSILKKVNSNNNPYTYLPKEILEKTISQLFTKSGVTQKVIQPASDHPNVVIILVENLTSKAINRIHENKEVTPYLNKLIGQGIYFENFYAAADRTDKTVVSMLSGYPAQPQESILEFSEKLEKLPILSKNFNQKGYSTQFYYGGEANFLTIKPFLFLGNFEKILEKDDFTSDPISLGATDESVYVKFIEEHKSEREKPFFSTILTLSSHEPFDTPQISIFTDNSIESQLFNSLNYADRSLENFLMVANKQDWWDNTLVIVVGNKGTKFPATEDGTDDYKIPMIWTGGVIKGPIQIKNVFAQTDLASTLLAQLKFANADYKWSKNIFDNKVKPWAFFTFNNGFGYITNKDQILFDNVGQIVINKPKMGKSKDLEAGKALQQQSFQDFLGQ
jgi:phosphoglycerol transferase MdoB-like AlkP superfamily enzyme